MSPCKVRRSGGLVRGFFKCFISFTKAVHEVITVEDHLKKNKQRNALSCMCGNYNSFPNRETK